MQTRNLTIGVMNPLLMIYNLWQEIDNILSHTLAASQAQGKAIKENILNRASKLL